MNQSAAIPPPGPQAPSPTAVSRPLRPNLRTGFDDETRSVAARAQLASRHTAGSALHWRRRAAVANRISP